MKNEGRASRLLAAVRDMQEDVDHLPSDVEQNTELLFDIKELVEDALLFFAIANRHDLDQAGIERVKKMWRRTCELRTDMGKRLDLRSYFIAILRDGDFPVEPTEIQQSGRTA
jgi:hypothetical protein